MPWSQTSPMEQRIEFIHAFRKKVFHFGELCHAFGISRKTGYKWVNRLDLDGENGFRELSRAPLHIPHKTPEEIEALLLEARRKHPTWGAGKILEICRRKSPGLPLPCRSVICDILKRHGLTKARRRRPHLTHPGKPKTQVEHPNDLWAADYKGQFRTLDGVYCYPLTISDYHSRYILGCQGSDCIDFGEAKAVFTRVFKENGLPNRIRTDNGAPFASTALSRLSQLSVWWIRLGITPELIEPGKPQQNSIHERMHKTLKADTTRPPAFELRGQQRKFNRFLEEFNNERPHEALGNKTPSEVYRKSEKQMPDRLPPVEYPAHFEKRRVSANGGIRWNCAWVKVSSTLKEEYVGLEEVDDGVWTVYFSKIKLGYLHEKAGRIEDDLGRFRRVKV